MKFREIIFIAAINLGFAAMACIAQGPKYQPPGELVDIGGYKLHLIVEGKEQTG